MFKKWFKKNEATNEQEFKEIRIYGLSIGDMFDFDLTTWEVVSAGRCDYDGHIESEWDVRGGIDSRTLVAIPDGADWNYHCFSCKYVYAIWFNALRNFYSRSFNFCRFNSL